jgi:hypothetical protein
MSKHTPGPWIWCSGEANEHDCYVIAEDENDVLATGLSEPDARLIAAAPDLLAALKEYIRDFGDNEDSDSQLMAAKARAAIAKAEGTS